MKSLKFLYVVSFLQMGNLHSMDPDILFNKGLLYKVNNNITKKKVYGANYLNVNAENGTLDTIVVNPNSSKELRWTENMDWIKGSPTPKRINVRIPFSGFAQRTEVGVDSGLKPLAMVGGLPKRSGTGKITITPDKGRGAYGYTIEVFRIGKEIVCETHIKDDKNDMKLQDTINVQSMFLAYGGPRMSRVWDIEITINDVGIAWINKFVYHGIQSSGASQRDYHEVKRAMPQPLRQATTDLGGK